MQFGFITRTQSDVLTFIINVNRGYAFSWFFYNDICVCVEIDFLKLTCMVPSTEPKDKVSRVYLDNKCLTANGWKKSNIDNRKLKALIFIQWEPGTYKTPKSTQPARYFILINYWRPLVSKSANMSTFLKKKGRCLWGHFLFFLNLSGCTHCKLCTRELVNPLRKWNAPNRMPSSSPVSNLNG